MIENQDERGDVMCRASWKVVYCYKVVMSREQAGEWFGCGHGHDYKHEQKATCIFAQCRVVTMSQIYTLEQFVRVRLV